MLYRFEKHKDIHIHNCVKIMDHKESAHFLGKTLISNANIHIDMKYNLIITVIIKPITMANK